ncbi:MULTISPECIES: EthD domain-containing protein [unclassified Mucilaginibacter]|uniref:EthD domain-containing protein n=1 Tax=unclassified Mucilaginibacter TaxID=2617802 RepID=UPI00339A8496
MIKFTILLSRKKDMSQEDFIAYHQNNHAPLFKTLPEVKQHVRKYVQCHPVPAAIPGLPPPAFDGITELWFDDVESIGKVFTSDLYMEVIRPDEAKFLDLHECSFLVSTEHFVI